MYGSEVVKISSELGEFNSSTKQHNEYLTYNPNSESFSYKVKSIIV